MPKSPLARTVFLIALSWLVLSVTRYRFLHPEQTETQLFLNTPDALLFRP